MQNDWVGPEDILGAMNVGVYVCDRERRIVYWSKRAEAITGWRAEDVVGHSCRDNILNHIDKEGAYDHSQNHMFYDGGDSFRSRYRTGR